MANWAQRERSNHPALVTMTWIARRLGRPAARAILRVVALYYLLFAPAARAASRDYLRRVLPQPPRLRQVYRHFFCFANSILDRVYLAGGDSDKLQFVAHGRDMFHSHRDSNTGAIIMMAHLGSFEMLRIMGRDHAGLRLRVLMDRTAGAKINRVLEAINPQAHATFIDTSSSDVDRVLKLQAALERGEMVSLMADRHRDGERTVDCDFLGDRAPFPVAPWLLASLTGAPVLIAFGLYRGGNRYDLHLEEFSSRIELPRAQRMQRAQAVAQAYADRLAHYARLAPYNWFNFYAFWD